LEKEFVDIIDETISRGGIAVVPAFAVGRTQEVLIMPGNINHPVYLDGMGQDITRLFLQFPDHLKDAELLRESANKVEWISNSSERKRVLYQPCVIVTTAGMINGGPIINYIQRLRSDPKSSIILTGYQVEGTNGRLLMEKGYIIDEHTNRKILVQMNVHQFDFSAHAGRHSLEWIAEEVSPEIAFVVHGDPECATSFGKFLETICDNIYIPEIGDRINIEV